MKSPVLIAVPLFLLSLATPASAQLRRRPAMDAPPVERAQRVFDLLGPEHLVREAWRTARRYWYDRGQLASKDWKGILERALVRAPQAKSPSETYAVINRMLGELKTSHLALVSYGVWRRELALEFRNRATFKAGCELVEIKGRYYVAGVATGSPAAKAGLLDGDEVLAIGGASPGKSALLAAAGHDPGLPGPPGYSIRLQKGVDVPFTIRRRKDGPRQQKTLKPAPFSLIQSARSSVRIERVGGVKVGVIELPHFIHRQMYRITRDALRGKLAQADALVLDVRGRGGSSYVVRMILSLFRGWRQEWTKPVVCLTDRTTRSAKEIFAWSWRRYGLPIVGERTQGACIGCGFRQLSDGSVLMVPMVDVRRLTRGVTLEGNGVKPTIAVPQAPLPFRAGKDTILRAGLKEAAARVKQARLAEKAKKKKKKLEVY